ncbi:MAG: hypothetical protein IKI75_11025 [Lachnospiraceae bacterium]|nr:hypothetical protein [Lachnospiraceae bacterium]
MACFLVSAAEAVVVTTAKHIEAKKEIRIEEKGGNTETAESRIPMSRKLKWLSNMLWGGVALLLFEHIWHGEVVPWFPFLTAMNSAEDTAEMLHEMATVGVCMAVLISVVWVGICIAADALAKKSAAAEGGRA